MENYKIPQISNLTLFYRPKLDPYKFQTTSMNAQLSELNQNIMHVLQMKMNLALRRK